MADKECPTPEQRAQWLNRVDQLAAQGELQPFDYWLAARIANVYVNADPEHDDYGAAWPKQLTMARDMGVSRETVRLAIRRLEAADLLHTESGRQHRSNRMRLNLNNLLERPHRAPPDAKQAGHLRRGKAGASKSGGRTPGPRAETQMPSAVGARCPARLASDAKQAGHDSYYRTLPTDSSDSSRPRDARAPQDSRTPAVQLMLSVWNDFCESIGQAKIHRLTDQNATRMHELLTEYGLGAWCAIVKQFAARVERAREEQDDPRPAYLGICLHEADELLERACNDGSYPPPDDLAI